MKPVLTLQQLHAMKPVLILQQLQSETPSITVMFQLPNEVSILRQASTQIVFQNPLLSSSSS
jgi:hypothetical protein